MTSMLNKILKLIFIVFFTNFSNLYSHNYINGGCQDHCEAKVKSIINQNNSINDNDQEQINTNYSCVNKSLCRG